MPERARCGAAKRNDDGEPCQLPAGWGTDHVGEGRCKHHDGGGAPEGNKNAVTTGEHETILHDQLDEEEQELWAAVDTDHLAQINKQIRTNKVRQRRMFARMKRLKGEELTLVKRETEEGHVRDGPIDVTRKSFRDAIERIQEIEDALTRVQKELRKLLREKYRILKDQPVDNSEKIDQLLARMDEMRGGDDTDEYTPPEME